MIENIQLIIVEIGYIINIHQLVFLKFPNL